MRTLDQLRSIAATPRLSVQQALGGLVTLGGLAVIAQHLSSLLR